MGDKGRVGWNRGKRREEERRGEKRSGEERRGEKGGE